MIVTTWDHREFEGGQVVYVLRSFDDKYDPIIGVFKSQEDAAQCSDECGGSHELTITEIDP